MLDVNNYYIIKHAEYVTPNKDSLENTLWMFAEDASERITHSLGSESTDDLPMNL